MKKLTGCRYERKIRNRATGGENLEMHIAGCPECRESQKVSEWMLKFAAQTPKPQSLPAPGLLLFKSQIIKKQSAARCAVQPFVWMQIASTLLVGLATVYLQAKSGISVGEILGAALASLSSVAPLLISSLIGAALICSAFAYFLRGTKKLKNNRK